MIALGRWLRRLQETTWRGRPIYPGYVRIAIVGHPYAIPCDARIEVQQRNGAWLPLRGVTSIEAKIVPDSIVGATLHIELTQFDLGQRGEDVTISTLPIA